MKEMASQILKQQENSYQLAFQSLDQKTAGRTPNWLSRLRESAMDRFEQLGFPSVKEEEWKYTNVAPISRVDFQPVISVATPFGTSEIRTLSYPETEATTLIFRNGIFTPNQEFVVQSGVVAMDLAEAIVDPKYAELVREHLARNADYNANGFTALNTALFSSGAFIFIPQNVVLESPLHLLFVSETLNAKAASFPRVLIVAEANSHATLVESYAGLGGGTYFTNAVVEIVLKDGARLEHYKIQRESIEGFHIATTSADLGSSSSYDTTTINFGGQLSRHDIQVRMTHEGAECRVDGLYMVGASQHTDTHSVIDHQQPHCTSHQLYKGILDGKSRAVFNGKIFVRHGAQKTDAMQTNKNLLLSDEARIDTKPQLEILADDVKCAHGAAVGQIDENELFYLETRGIHPDLAKNLLTYGFAEEVIDKIKIESIKKQLDEAVLNRINARLEV